MFGPSSLKQPYLKNAGKMNNIFTVTLNPAVDRELTVPEIKYDTVLRASDWRVDFGGKGFNVSRMLKSLGANSVAMGFAGGKSGEILQEGLESLEIGTDFVWVAGETRTNVSIVSEADHHYIKANEPGPTITPTDQQALLDKVTAVCKHGDWWVLAGSLPPGVPPTYYQRLISIINQSGARVVLDTSGEPLSHGCHAGPFLIKPNDYELEKLTGMPTGDRNEILAAAKSLDSLGVSNSLVSMGKHGALLITKEDSWMIKSPKIQERNPIGAGDSLVGGVVWGLAQNLPLVEAARWGVACGAAAASLSGTAVGSLELVKTLYSQTEVGPEG
jgi:1-phosphofructokinase family hexose kinase